MNTQMTSENITSGRMVRPDFLRFSGVLCPLAQGVADACMQARLQGAGRLPYLVRAVIILAYWGIAVKNPGSIKPKLTKERLFFAINSDACLFGRKRVCSCKVVAAGGWNYNYTPAMGACFLMPIMLFLACMAAALNCWPAVAPCLALFSFGIYLVHPVFLWETAVNPTAYASAKFLCALAVTSISAWLTGKRPPFSMDHRLGPLPVSPARKPRLAGQSPSIFNHTKKEMQWN